MTVHGTIFGHDKYNDITAVRKFGAFAGTTWLRHAKAITETGAASTEADFGLNGKTLKVVITKDGKSLHHMVVQVDDMVSAIYNVKEKTLLAAQMEKGNFVGETDELSAMFLGLDARDSKGRGTSIPENGTKAGDTTTLNAKNEGREAESTISSEQSEQGTIEHESRSSEYDDCASSSSSPTAKLSKIRILEIRAEAMAEAFREDICGPLFKMPAEFR